MKKAIAIALALVFLLAGPAMASGKRCVACSDYLELAGALRTGGERLAIMDLPPHFESLREGADTLLYFGRRVAMEGARCLNGKHPDWALFDLAVWYAYGPFYELNVKECR